MKKNISAIGIVLCFVGLLVWGLRSSLNKEIYAQSDSEISEEAEMDSVDSGAAEDNNGAGVYQENNPLVKYRKPETWKKNISGGDGTYTQSNTVGASARLVFRGNSVSVVLRKGENTGIARIILRDMAAKTNVVNKTEDLYKPGAAVFQEYTYGNLDPTRTYRIMVRVTGTKNTLANNTLAGVDKFVVASNSPTSVLTPTIDPSVTLMPTDGLEPTDIPDPENDPDIDEEDSSEDALFEAEALNVSEATAGIYEEDNERVKYRKPSTWIKNNLLPAPLSGKYASSSAKGAAVFLKFKGKKASVVLRKGKDVGQAFINIKKVGGKAVKKETKELYNKGKVKFVKYTYDNLNENDTHIIRVRVTGKKHASSTGTILGFDKFIIEGEGVVPTNTPGGPTNTPDPTDSEEENVGKYEVPIGSKGSLTINIGGVVPTNTPGGPTNTPDPSAVPSVPPPNPQVVNMRFKAKVFGAGHTPDIQVRLKIIDLVLRITPGPVRGDANACNDPSYSEYLVEGLTLSSSSEGKYAPKPGTTYIVRKPGADPLQGIVAAGRWIGLPGLTEGRSYSILLKGPKHLGEKVIESVTLRKITDLSSSFVEPTDTPDPENDPEVEAEDTGEDSIFEEETLGLQAVGAGTYEEDDDNVKYKKPETWTKDNPLPGSSGGKFAKSSTKGAVVFLKFKSSKVTVFLRKASDAGQAFINIKKAGGNVVKKVTKDLYKNGSAEFTEYTFEDLSPSDTYIIRVRVTGNKNADSSDKIVGFDKFVVGGNNTTPTADPSISASPTEDINRGSQDFDWTSLPMHAGDVPDPEDNFRQDCVVNMADVSLVKNRFRSTKADDLRVADLNFDDFVDTRDLGQMNVTLSTRPDED